ncbi:MAG: Hsp20/alpha crystallin family protein [Gammaproteobacteria bacterium]|nr:Hsp20/alpha crystallin family protein [Gammaproteobacteria bacterium]
MNITRFEPWSLTDLLHHDFNRLATRRTLNDDADEPATRWVPAVDIVEETGRFVLRADVPGVDADAIDVSMDAGILTVSGERQAEEISEEAGARRIERSSGRFQRRFTLPEAADAEAITAKSRNGILEVVIPKLPEIQARRISVEAA